MHISILWGVDDMSMYTRVRGRRPAGAVALVAALGLALAGCGDGGTDGAADARPPATTAPATPAAPPVTETPSPTPSSTPTPSPTPTPTAVTLADFTGRGVGSAVRAAKKAGVDYAVRLQGTGRAASSWGSAEKVCEQSGAPGTVTFTVARDGRDCAGRLLYTPPPAPAPAKTRDAGGSASGATGTGSGGTGSGTAACELTSPAGNCYADGQFCAARHRGLSTHGRGGEYLTCAKDASGRWRWSDGVAG